MKHRVERYDKTSSTWQVVNVQERGVVTKLVGFIQTRACVQFICVAQGYHRDAQWLGGGRWPFRAKAGKGILQGHNFSQKGGSVSDQATLCDKTSVGASGETLGHDHGQN